jgi:hypothetical protein
MIFGFNKISHDDPEAMERLWFVTKKLTDQNVEVWKSFKEMDLRINELEDTIYRLQQNVKCIQGGCVHGEVK